jgi:hypothetical protein
MNDFEIIIHAGTVKTGSTFLQKNLLLNSQFLSSVGLCYYFVSDIKNKERYANGFEFLNLNSNEMEYTLNKLKKEGYKKIILSEEGIWGNANLLGAECLANYKKKIIIYIRNPVEVIASWAGECSKPYNSNYDFNTGYEPLSIDNALSILMTDYIKLFENFLSNVYSFKNCEILFVPYASNILKQEDSFFNFLKLVDPLIFFGNDSLKFIDISEMKINESVDRKYADISSYLYYKYKAIAHSSFYSNELVDYVYNNTKSGDIRPIYKTLSADQINRILVKTDEISRKICFFNQNLNDIFTKKHFGCDDYLELNYEEVNYNANFFIFNTLNKKRNLFKSVNFSNTTNVWIPTNATISTSPTHSPLGEIDCFRFNRVGFGVSNIEQSIVTKAQLYTLSIYAKAGSEQFLTIQVHLDNDIKASFVSFDLKNGTFGLEQTLVADVGLNIDMKEITNGWYRCSVIFIGGAYNTHVFFGVANSLNVRTGSNKNYIYIWGPQIEVGSLLSSFKDE